jgi:hypothetical protein
MLQRVIRAIEGAKCESLEQMKEVLKGALRGQDHLLQECLSLFDDEKPPDRLINPCSLVFSSV